MVLPVKIEVRDKRAVDIAWDDGTTSHIDAAALRGACMCAGCREPSGAQATKAVLEGSQPVTIEEARLVGGYAITFTFGPDGHGTGIYPFDSLREFGSGGDVEEG